MKNILKKYYIYIISFILFIISIISIKQCSYNKYLYKNSISALTDTIKYYNGKNNEHVATKTILETNINNLKYINDSLYNVLKNIKVKNPDNVTYIETIISNEKHDTCWVINKSDSINTIYKQFNFSDQYHKLDGYIYYIKKENKKDSLGLSIDHNQTFANFTVTQKDNQLYIVSNNPYIKYNNIIAIKNTNSKNIQKNKRFGIGPYIGVGINYKGQIQPTIGIGLNWSFIKF